MSLISSLFCSESDVDEICYVNHGDSGYDTRK